jgi:hypothetical protein
MSTAVTPGHGQNVAIPRALFRQPKALQWFEDGKLMKATQGERQAGNFPPDQPQL